MSIPTPEQAFTKKYFQYEEPLTDAEVEIERTLVNKMQKYKPRFEDFEDIYSASELEQDQTKLEEQKLQEKESHERALILEAILGHHIEQSNWFGPDCSVAFASEYDDRFSHTDLILEFDRNDKIVRLAIDATIAENPETFEKKRNYIKQDIEKAQLTNLKYFISEADPNAKGEIFGIPRVIIGTNKEVVQKLSEIVVNKKNKELAQSPLQLNLLKAIKNQLEDEIKYTDLYFRKNTKKRIFVANRHKEILKIINQVLNQKEKALGQASELKENINWSGDIRGLEYLSQKGY